MAQASLIGQSALITGASSGIGRGIAIAFAIKGVNLALTYHSDEGEMNTTLHEIHDACEKQGKDIPKILSFQCDVSDYKDVNAIFDQSIETLYGIDIVVNNAGIQLQESSHHVSPDAFNKVLSVNLNGAYYGSSLAIQHWLSTNRPGCIINVSSVHQLIPKPEFVSYAASKAAVNQMTRTLALEYASQGIRINNIAPGAIETPINDSWLGNTEKKAMVESNIPMRDIGLPEDIADAAVFLASSKARYITGQTLFVDGGLSLFPKFEENWTS